MSAAAVVSDKKYGFESAQPEKEKNQRIRVTLYSTDLKSLEKVCAAFVSSAKQKNLTVKGPVRMPIRKLRITTRKTPCGEGSKTWDKFELRVYKRIVDIYAPQELMKQISTFATIEPNVEVEVTVSEDAH